MNSIMNSMIFTFQFYKKIKNCRNWSKIDIWWFEHLGIVEQLMKFF